MAVVDNEVDDDAAAAAAAAATAAAAFACCCCCIRRLLLTRLDGLDDVVVDATDVTVVEGFFSGGIGLTIILGT